MELFVTECLAVTLYCVHEKERRLLNVYNDILGLYEGALLEKNKAAKRITDCTPLRDFF